MLKSKKIVLMIAVAVCFIMALSLTAFAAPKIAESDNCNLTVGFQKTQVSEDPDYAVAGVDVKLYRVCSMTDTGEVAPTEDFKELSISPEYDTVGEADSVRSQALSMVTSNTDVTYTTKTDADKKARFTNIEKGIYLVVIDPYKNGDKEYGIDSAIVMIPEETNDNTWDYDLEIELKGFEIVKQKNVINVIWNDEDDKSKRPESVEVTFTSGNETVTVTVDSENGWKAEVWLENKEWTVTSLTVDGYTYTVTPGDHTYNITYDKVKVEPQPEKKETVVIEIGGKEEEVPDTGLLWWPVSLLAVAGVSSVAYGVIRHKHNDEK